METSGRNAAFPPRRSSKPAEALMRGNNVTAAVSAAFLTVITSETHGVFGGYLVLNAIGRPLEFHCTAPVKPNRAQEILYGPTLEEYLFAEQIGQTLVKQASATPPVILTDVPALLALRHYIAPPVCLVLPGDDQTGADDDRSQPARVDSSHAKHLLASQFRCGGRPFAVLAEFEQDVSTAGKHLDGLGATMDLLEPFERIREAVNEAQLAGR
jgi:hypothetical protein